MHPIEKLQRNNFDHSFMLLEHVPVNEEDSSSTSLFVIWTQLIF